MNLDREAAKTRRCTYEEVLLRESAALRLPPAEVFARDRGWMTAPEYAAREGITTVSALRRLDRGWVLHAYQDKYGYWHIPIRRDGALRSRVPRSEIDEQSDLVRLSEWAASHGKSKTRAHQLKDQGRLDALGLVETPFGFRIPHDAPWPEPRRGGRPGER